MDIRNEGGKVWRQNNTRGGYLGDELEQIWTQGTKMRKSEPWASALAALTQAGSRGDGRGGNQSVWVMVSVMLRAGLGAPFWRDWVLGEGTQLLETRRNLCHWETGMGRNAPPSEWARSSSMATSPCAAAVGRLCGFFRLPRTWGQGGPTVSDRTKLWGESEEP